MYRLTDAKDIGKNTQARYNIAPTQTVPFVTAGDNGSHRLHEGRWGLVPFWAMEVLKASTFNARSEDAASKPMWREPWKSRRCLIPADGFYEWTKNNDDGGRDPWFIQLPDQKPFSFAGLWAHNDRLDIESCTILTTAAAEPMQRLHDRQPIILETSAYDAWLDPNAPTDGLKAVLELDLDSQLEFFRVGREVNTYKAQGPELVAPVA